MLWFDPQGREYADDFLSHPYFDQIRSIIELEIKELSKLDQDDFKKFKQKNVVKPDERQIIKNAIEFWEQERMNDEFKYEEELENPSDDNESEYQSSEDGELNDFENEIEAISQSDISDNAFNEQSDIIEKYFEVENTNRLSEEFANEIQEEEDSNLSENSIKKPQAANQNLRSNVDVPHLNTK